MPNDAAHDRVAEDIKTYRQHVRPNFPAKYHKLFNTPGEHPYMHQWFTNRGLKVVKGNYTYYDAPTHTLYHHNPEDKSSVVREYLRSATRPVKLSRGDAEERAFQHTLEHHPEDHTNKLVYADWLQEHGADESAQKLRVWAKLHRALDEAGADRLHSDRGRFAPWVRQLLLVHRLRHGIHDHLLHNAPVGRDTLLPALAAVERHALGVGGPVDLRQHHDNVRVLAQSPRMYDRALDQEPVGVLTLATDHLVDGIIHDAESPTSLHHADGWADYIAPRFERAAKDHLYHEKLSRSGGLRKHPEIATLLRQVAESPDHDATLHGVLADRISELTGPDDPRAETVRHAVPEDEYGGLPGGHVTWPLSEDRGDTGDPLTAYHDSTGVIRTGMELRGVGPHNADWSYPFTPAVEWHVQLPRGPYVKFVRLHTPESLHDMIDRLPARYRKAWREAAIARGWHDPRPTKLSRVGQMKSDTHNTRLAVARHVLAEAGVGGLVTAVLAHTDGRGVRPGVAAMVGKPLPPVLARYVAAWMGMLTGEKQMTVFHPGDGEDTLHIIDSPHASEHVGEYLKRAGVRSFSMQPKGAGTRAFIVSPMDLGDVQNAAAGLQGQHTAVRGTAVRLGAGTDAEARSAYRQVIDDAEKAAGGQ